MSETDGHESFYFLAEWFFRISQTKRFHHKDQGRTCWRGVLPARWPSAPPVVRAARGLPRAALRAPTLQVLNLEPHENTLPIIHDMQLDKHNKHRLHNKLEGTGEQAEVPAAPSHLNAAAAGAAAAARASPPEPIAAAACLPPPAAAWLPCWLHCCACCCGPPLCRRAAAAA